MFLEDQRWPKRCGHMRGKDVTTQEEYAEKLGAALDARRSRDFVVVARTDARATGGLDEAIERGRAEPQGGRRRGLCRGAAHARRDGRDRKKDRPAAGGQHDRGRRHAGRAGQKTARDGLQHRAPPALGAVRERVGLDARAPAPQREPARRAGRGWTLPRSTSWWTCQNTSGWKESTAAKKPGREEPLSFSLLRCRW